MNKTKNANLTDLSKNLRKNMTPEEKHLWYDYLKTLPETIQRQKVIGPYIADFYCAAACAIIEIDGAQHYDAEARDCDRRRDEYMYAQGIDVWRYTNREIHERFAGVCDDISRRIAAAKKRGKAKPSPLGEGTAAGGE